MLAALRHSFYGPCSNAVRFTWSFYPQGVASIVFRATRIVNLSLNFGADSI